MARHEKVITEIQTIREETLAIKREIEDVQTKTGNIRKEAEKIFPNPNTAHACFIIPSLGRSILQTLFRWTISTVIG